MKRVLCCIGLCGLFGLSDLAATEVNWAAEAMASASSHRGTYAPGHVKDGIVSDASRWLAAENDEKPWVVLAFPEPITVGMIDVFSGWKTGDPLKAFDVSVEVDRIWQRHANWSIRNNANTSKRIYIDRTRVTKMRLALLKRGAARIREIAVYDNKEAQGLKDVGVPGNEAEAYSISLNQHQMAVNQVGYFTDRPKRFTAPLSADGTEFTIREQDTAAVLYRGVINGGVGDFTAFRPADSDARYVIELSGGTLRPNTSDPFLIRGQLDQEQYWQTATDFLNDVRSVVGTHPSAYGGCAFRDGTYYDAIVPALVLFYLSDPQCIESMPRQIDWQADKTRATAPDFAYIRDGAQPGVMDAVRNYYQLEAPNPNAPDVVKMIHWGAGYILMRPNGRDPSASVGNDDSCIEPQTVEQVAYVLWAWPALKQWLPQSFYDQCRDFCFKFWNPEGGPRGGFTQGGSANQRGTSALDISPWWDPDTYMTIESFDESIHNPGHMHPFKGRHAPGHSIVPNLLMHEVAVREGRDDADIYLNAAVKQADWIIKNLDWNDSRTTKGHRLSEHRTIPNLVWLLQKYPEQAPAGLKEKITEWARIAVSRSNNLWDFRRFGDTMWTIPGMNEVGNSLSLPAIALSASWVVDDPTLKEELERIAIASIDHVFGRNPMLHAAPSHPKQGFPEVERGWPKRYKLDVCARLEGVRGNIASMPGSGMYPFQPGTDFRHPEGWSNYGASWCISLSYLQFDKHASTPDMNGLLFKAGRYAFKVDPVGFRFSFEDYQGHTMVRPHNIHGLLLNGQPIVEITKSDLALGEFIVRTADGQTAMVKVSLNGELACLKVVPQNKGENAVALSVSGMPVAHGLGDNGAWGPSFNLVRDKVHRYELKHDGGKQRWVSSFVIFPQNDFAGVCFDQGHKTVTLGKDQYTMSLRKEGGMSFYYLLGEPGTIYRNYLSLREELGYPNIKPKFRLFELGWESWDALGYQTSAETVRHMIAKLLEEGYPIRWAVTGSGYWEDKGTTTSFGKFGPKFEDHRGFKAWLHDHNVKWMIGQRTNLVPSGGPYHTKAKTQDANSKTKVYNGNPASDEGLARGYFLKNEQGEVIEKASRWYPQIACYILDGRISKAAEWFVKLYQKWGVDGIKEDTMMDLGSNYDIYNGPSALIAQKGGLVMARCGSFSAPGTLLRINDTNGAASMQKRTPINYMQYAACGAPNVYSDTIGFHGISHVEATLRHGWMMATTAGLAIGKEPAKWDRQQQTMFRKMINFHYQLGPYLYDAAMKTYHTGYPFTLTPVSIAYPHDREAAQTTHYQWMMGESILAAPLVKGYKSGKLDVYLPEGTWFDYDTGRQYEGPLLLDEYEMPLDKTPCFIGGKGVVVLRESDNAPLKAKIYPIVKDRTAFTFHYPDGGTHSVIELSALNDKTVVIDATTGKTIRAAVEHQTGALSFDLQPGHNYTLK